MWCSNSGSKKSWLLSYHEKYSDVVPFHCVSLGKAPADLKDNILSCYLNMNTITFSKHLSFSSKQSFLTRSCHINLQQQHSAPKHCLHSTSSPKQTRGKSSALLRSMMSRSGPLLTICKERCSQTVTEQNILKNTLIPGDHWGNIKKYFLCNKN